MLAQVLVAPLTAYWTRDSRMIKTAISAEFIAAFRALVFLFPRSGTGLSSVSYELQNMTASAVNNIIGLWKTVPFDFFGSQSPFFFRFVIRGKSDIVLPDELRFNGRLQEIEYISSWRIIFTGGKIGVKIIPLICNADDVTRMKQFFADNNTGVKTGFKSQTIKCKREALKVV